MRNVAGVQKKNKQEMSYDGQKVVDVQQNCSMQVDKMLYIGEILMV